MPDALVLRALGLGDTLTGVPALRGLRRLLPEHRITLACPPAMGDWLVDLAIIDAVLPTAGLDRPLEWTGPPPDVAVDLHGNGPESHTLLSRLRPRRLFGFACPPVDFTDGPIWDAAAHEVDKWCSLIEFYGGACSVDDLRLPVPERARGEHIVIHPGAKARARQWPVERWRAVAEHLPADVHVTGSAGERELGRAVAQASARVTDLTGALDLPALAAEVASARLVLSTDTGIAHLALAMGTPSVAIFGPISPSVWGPRIDQDHHLVIWHDDIPSPGLPNADRLDPRIAAVTVEEVVAAARGFTTPNAPRAGGSVSPAAAAARGA
ncbi:glycosyltransferase family 9 protein [Calidifontibacter sp. DB0510]|uniref:Glycosyltransferase family 9 protein n=1 Tax=Metallococcus carri TaxID=1656884 RepID=A0A967AZK8_9MICO|nr:glycosyltransferase family 9 protein [Metallococcus carri]NHN54658.1 glycosyltransferase family 9 protein [Metallococcus carri]NOP37003.1 glycosyltransferase family 9 protein [Calidifontibacter sp. DB2511S]